MIAPLNANEVLLSGTNLIEASAGTGKTHAIATLYVRSLLETSARVENILVVTYTRAATAELRDRIRRRITKTREALRAGTTKDASLQALVDARVESGNVEGDCKRLSLALRSFDQAAIFTIHGFCQRCLQESAFESGTAFESEFEADDVTLAYEIADDFWSSEMFDVDPTLFAFYESQKLSPTTVRNLAKTVIGNPDMDVLPATVESDSGLGEFPRCFVEARDIWRTERGSIVELLTSTSSLNKKSYKESQITEKYAPDLDHLFASEQAMFFDETHALHKLTTEALSKGTNRGKRPPTHEFFEKASALAEASQGTWQYFEDQLLALRMRFIAYLRQENVARKAQQSTLSFDDLLLQLRAALRDGKAGEDFAAAIVEQYPLALIDEFQDTDPVQYEIFRRVYHRGREAAIGRALFLIGDPKQAIYGFRGADLFTYFKARRDAADRTHTLATNYRSSPDMVRAANTVFEATKDCFLFEELEYTPVRHASSAENLLVDEATNSAALEILMLDRRLSDGTDGTLRTKKNVPKAGGMNKDIARTRCVERTAGEIVRLLLSGATLGDRPVQPGDIAVLVRENKQARAMQDALGAFGVPSVLESDASVFTTDDAAELGRVLQAMAVPRDPHAIRAALSTDLLGRNAVDLTLLRENEDAWEEALFAFRDWNETWTKRGFFPAFSQMMQEQGVAERLLSRMDGERKMTNLGQLAELLQERALQSSSGPQTLCAWLETMRVDSAARKAAGESAQLRLETDAASVTVVTVHKSKGLEYGIVFCPFAWQGQRHGLSKSMAVRFHDANDDNRLKLDIGSDDIDQHREQSAREALAEDLRLLYVALTRARHRCTVVCGVISSFGSSALAYLLLRDDALETTPEALKDFEKRLEKFEDEELWTKLQVHREHGIAIRRLLTYEGPAYERARHSSTSLRSREATRSLSSAWRTSSFTGLTRNADRDHDHDAGAPAVVPNAQAQDRGETITMAKVPAGAHPGQMLHHIFEHLDFCEAKADGGSSDALSSCVGESLHAFGFDASRWQAPLTQAYKEILTTPLPAPKGQREFSLGDVQMAKRLDELEFNIPVRTGESHFQASMLAEALAKRSSTPWPRNYTSLVRGLGFRPLTGFLKGFMDLVFEHDGRWYLADYKSNMLGDRYGDYGNESMARAMAEHHYYVQYHIYLVALNRYLRARIDGYDYERDFGGVYYFFIRGMGPEAPRGNGVYVDRPSAIELAALSEALGGHAS